MTENAQPQVPGVDEDETTATPNVDVTTVDEDDATSEPTATTAGEEDHRDPNAFRGKDADAPADAGTPPQDN